MAIIPKVKKKSGITKKKEISCPFEGYDIAKTIPKKKSRVIHFSSNDSNWWDDDYDWLDPIY